MMNRYRIPAWLLLASAAAGSSAVLADESGKPGPNLKPTADYAHPESAFDRAIREAPDRARAESAASDKAQKEGDANRAAAGVGHEGRLGTNGQLSPATGPSFGAKITPSSAVPNVRFDLDKPAPARAPEPEVHSAPPAPAPAAAPAHPNDHGGSMIEHSKADRPGEYGGHSIDSIERAEHTG
jgi:hypothetical protein